MFGLEDQIGTRVHFMSPGGGERVGSVMRSPEQSSLREKGRRRDTKYENKGVSPDVPDSVDKERKDMEARDKSIAEARAKSEAEYKRMEEKQNEEKKAA